MEMDSIIMCGYSVHRQYISTGESGRHHYVFRLQSHGECDARLNGAPIRLQKGDLLLLLPDDRLAINKRRGAEGDTSGDYYLLCDGDWVAAWFQQLGGTRIARVSPDETVMELWRLLIRETRRLPAAPDEKLLETLLHAFCFSVERLLHTDSAGRADFVVERMKRYVEAHAFEPLRVFDVADAVRLSESRASHLFRETTGQSLIGYLTDVRLNAAMEQMKYTASPLDEIAANTGFGSYAYFHRIFRREMKISPGAWRKKAQEEAADL